MDTELKRLTGHNHSVSDAYHSDGLECDACDGSYSDGYCCRVCKFTIHQKCAFLFSVGMRLKHPSHDGHVVKLLTTGAPDHTDLKCYICGENTKRLLFHCSTCNLNLDIDCMAATVSPQGNPVLPWHPHPLLKTIFTRDMCCEVCLERQGGYFCPRCRLSVHYQCLSALKSPEITHPSHVRHPLKLLTVGAPDYTDQRCDICGDDTENLLYHYDICKFNLDLYCAVTEPQPVSLPGMKVHEHTLTLMPKVISFVCDACGTEGDGAPYVCTQCDFMTFHQKCARLPLVIHVNHHHHRVSYKYTLGPGEWKCGVCLEEIDWSYGAYTCSHCPTLALHSRCATRKDVWDGKELDGVPEEVEDIEPFKRNDDNTITHFAHVEHNLSLNEDGIALEGSILCGACVRPIGSYTFYSCSDCSFILHETCANLPKKKRHFLSTTPLTLEVETHYDVEKCHACQQCCLDEGFMYVDGNERFDILCSSITVPFIHGSHPHPLFYLKLSDRGGPKKCKSCAIHERGVVIGCLKCDFYLDFRCATLPLTVRLHRYDDHSLTLCYGEEASGGKYWCDICERETNPETWFYTCKDCGVALHVLCVLGDLRYAKPGGKIEEEVDLIPNDTSSRPLCYRCHCRCIGPFILKNYDSLFLCSFYCLSLVRNWRKLRPKLRCPWALEPNT